MAIRFACANCGKYHRIADRYAGKAGRCGRCGHRFIAPGVSSRATAPAFVPASAPNLYASQLGAGRRRLGGIGVAMAGLVIAGITLLLIFRFRDPLAAAVPVLAPMLPPKAIVPPPAPRAAPVITAGTIPDWEAALAVLGVLSSRMAYLAGGIVLPVVGPPILSRRGYLSVGRWLIFAGLALFLMVPTVTVTLVGFPARMLVVHPQLSIYYAMSWTLFLAVCGCLIAAAIYPKPKP